MGAMRVTASFAADNSYRIEIVVDCEHLPTGMSPFAGLAESAAGAAGAAVSDRSTAIERFRRQILDAIQITFDGSPLQPARVETPDSLPSTAIRGSSKLYFVLTGTVPRGAKTVAWSESLPLGFYLLRMQNEGDEEPTNQWLEIGQTSGPFPLRHITAPPTRLEIVRQYLVLGYTHIVPKGLDHILFVLGIFFLSFKRKPILIQVTAFTIAHSITLGLSIYGIVSLSPRIVEPLIAISIVYVAVENLFVGQFTARRVAVVFAFGLLHGMGFAGVLKELGLPRSEFIPALVSFNVGVEIGQLTVIAAAFLLVGYWFGAKPWYRSRVTIPASLAIALVGLYWTFQRIFF